MKILFIINSLGAGGAESSTRVLCEYLERIDIDFEIICLKSIDVGFQQIMLEKGYKIIFLKSQYFISQVFEIANYIKKNNFSLVHSILYRSNLRTRFAKLVTSFKHLESLVNTTYSKERFADVKVNQFVLRIYKFIDRASSKYGVDHFHSITETVKFHYIDEINLNPQKITVIPRGRKPLLSQYEDKPSINKIVNLINVGRHEFQKGQIYLLKAIKILQEKNYKFHLTILGRNGNETPNLLRYIKNNNLEAYVTLEGFKSNVPDFLIHSDVFIFPSLYEGLGGALIEAQSAALPVACNDIAVLHEVVKKDINAKFFDVHDPAEIANAISYFLDNPEKRIEYGQRSLDNFRLNFMEDDINERMVNLYQTIINES